MAKSLLLIPAFNESTRLPGFLNQLIKENEVITFDIDICILDDGSREFEYEKMYETFLSLKDTFSLYETKLLYQRFPNNIGKGAVLRRSMEDNLAKYEYIGFLDADGSTAFSEWLRLLEEIKNDINLGAVIGSRFKGLGYEVQRTFKRFISGRIFATLLSNLFDISVYDSQCGAKIFRVSELNRKILNFCDNDRWLFDTQLVLLLYGSGTMVKEVPVNWCDMAGSKISLIKDSISMFIGLLRFKLKYKAKVLELSRDPLSYIN
jgi:glycosyltransferase involved in cell wall biosynthesis